MAKVQITNVTVLDNPASFLNPFQFEITFECADNLSEDLEWKIIYVGSAESEEYDQTLDSVLVGPVSQGKHMFVFQADPPNPDQIPQGDILGVTVVLITCSYKGQEFIRVGYYVNNEYCDPELNESEAPPASPQFDKVMRNILHTKPRVTRFTIDWDDSENIPPQPPNIQEQQQQQQQHAQLPPHLQQHNHQHHHHHHHHNQAQVNGVKDVGGKGAEYGAPMNTDSNSSIPEYTQDMDCH